MSWVANLMIQADPEDRDSLRGLSAWLESEAPRSYDQDVRGVGSLAELTSADGNHWGGWKNPECEVWAGALNHADLDAVLARVAVLRWRFPGRVQVLLMDQEESYFRLYMFRGGAWNQYAPPPPSDPNDQHAW